MVQQFFEKPSEKNIEKFKNFISAYTFDWTDEMKDTFIKELKFILETWRKLNPKWKEWTKKILGAISSFFV